MERSKVPLWLAVILRKNGKCRIEIPQWMTVGIIIYLLLELDNLKRALEFDRKVDFVNNPSLYSLPTHYIEISRLLLEKYLAVYIINIVVKTI